MVKTLKSFIYKLQMGQMMHGKWFYGNYFVCLFVCLFVVVVYRLASSFQTASR